MCAPDNKVTMKSKTNATTGLSTKRDNNNNRREIRLLYSLESFDSRTKDEKLNDDGTGQYYIPPSFGSCLITCFVLISIFFMFEYTLRYIFEQNQHWHPLLQIQINRYILARHIGVDAFCCCMCAILGLLSKHVCQDIFKKIFSFTSTQNNKKTAFDMGKVKKDDDYDNNDRSKNNDADVLLHASGHCERLFTYNPYAFRIALFFLCYQFKNTYDSYVWNDGPEFLFHHIFSIITALGAMYPGCGHLYTVFFFGISEISTAILCLLSNFDDKHGVTGLGDAFPMTKIALGGLFVIGFIICRVILWPVFAYYFSRDVVLALRKSKYDHRVERRRNWLKFFLVSLTGISFLQVAWLGQIFILGKEELNKAGLL